MDCKKMVLLTAVSLILCFALTSAASADEEPVGFIKKLKGNVSIMRESQALSSNLGDPVYMNDVIKTGKASSMGVTFIDNTMISLGADTEFAIDEYVFKPREQKKGLSFISSVSKGTLHFISGGISKLAPESVSVKTPEGTIGIRGTRFLVKVTERK